MADISRVVLPDNNEYCLKDEVARVSIPFAKVDATSTATVFTASVPGITELYDGVACYLMNGVVTSASGFTININNLGALPVYSTMAAATRSTTIFNINYTMLFVYNSKRVAGGCWDCYYGYDSNANTIGYQIRTNSSTRPVTDATYRYRILFSSADDTKWVPATASTSTNATASRAVCQTKINPFGEIVYYSYTTAIAAGSSPGATYLWKQYAISLGYSFNRTGAALVLNYPKPIYIKCTPQSDGSAIIDPDTPYVQTLPSTEDGKIYIYLGRAYSATNVELVIDHPVYEYKDGCVRLYTNSAAGSGSVTETDPIFTGSPAYGITSSDIADWNAKQNALVFDGTPTFGSDNPVTSSGIWDAVERAGLCFDMGYITDYVESATALTLGSNVLYRSSSETRLYTQVKAAYDSGRRNISLKLSGTTSNMLVSFYEPVDGMFVYNTEDYIFDFSHSDSVSYPDFHFKTILGNGTYEALLAILIVSRYKIELIYSRLYPVPIQEVTIYYDDNEDKYKFDDVIDTITTFMAFGSNSVVIRDRTNGDVYRITYSNMSVGVLRAESRIANRLLYLQVQVTGFNPITYQLDISRNIISDDLSAYNNDAGFLTDEDGQLKSNLVTSISSSSTNDQYPSAKLLYDTVGNVETLLAAI